jgi:hypothetical protein
MPLPAADVPLETAAHAVQLALTPVFLLSGLAALLSVFSTRLGRVADQADAVAAHPGEGGDSDRRLEVLRLRSRALDMAVVLAAIAGLQTCAAILVLFLGAVIGASAANILFTVFGGAVVFTMGSLIAFVVEMLLAARSVRLVVDFHLRRRMRRTNGDPR